MRWRHVLLDVFVTCVHMRQVLAVVQNRCFGFQRARFTAHGTIFLLFRCNNPFPITLLVRICHEPRPPKPTRWKVLTKSTEVLSEVDNSAKH